MTLIELDHNKKLILDGTSIDMVDGKFRYFFARGNYFRRYIDHYNLHDDLTDLGKEVYDAVNSTSNLKEQKKKVAKIWRVRNE